MEPFSLAIIGGGPSCTYVMERLAATSEVLGDDIALEVHIFERTGEFGAGAVHSSRQPTTSYLNRIAGQVAFAADETVEGTGSLLPKSLRPALHEWCGEKFAETGHPHFDLSPEDWPRRYVHGLALRDMFGRYADLLRRRAGVRLELHACEAIDVIAVDDGFRIVTRPMATHSIRAHHVLFLTGHSHSDPRCSPVLRRWLDFARTHAVRYVPNAYPLEQTFPYEAVTPHTVVGCAGMGLSAIDLILYLTEGRGGRFEQIGGHLVYRPSGEEPASIVAFGSTGLFTFARPYNAKVSDPARLEHRGVFLTRRTVERLREAVGTPMEISRIGVRRQLDFERHVFPVMLLEMAYVYYATLLGPEFGRYLARRAKPAFEAFVSGAVDATPAASVAHMLEPVERAVDEAADAFEAVLRGERTLVAAQAAHVFHMDGRWSVRQALDRYLYVVFGPEGRDRIAQCLDGQDAPGRVRATVSSEASPWKHAASLRENRFSWERIANPLPADACTSPEGFRDALLNFMERDHLWAAQNNVDNPAKAAADGVWRDLRGVLAEAVDFGGLTAASHREFLSTYMRHHNRLANGASLEVMERIRALVECGLVDASVGPRPVVDAHEPSGRFRVYGQLTGAKRFVDVLVDARVHAFDPKTDISPLYQNLCRRGLVRTWHNPATDGHHFEPGGLDLSPEFHPVRSDGAVDVRLTFLGPPSEGVMFFQLGALRPNYNHHVMRDIVCWLHGFWRAVAEHASPSDSTRPDAVGSSPAHPAQLSEVSLG